MEGASPPKRMTRARAAAKDAAKDAVKANANAGKATAATTSTKAKAASTSNSTSSSTSTPAPSTTSATSTKSTTTTRPVTTTTTRTATKRKARDDDTEDEDNNLQVQQQNAMNKPARTRGRPKKITETQSEPESAPKPEPSVEGTSTASTKASRSRAKRPATAATTTASKPDPPKTTRASTRTRKTTTTTTTDDESDGEPAAKPATTKPVRKTTRTRATASTKASAGTITNAVSTEPTPGLKSAVSRPASRIGGVTKKTVTFQEPEKENMLPPAPPKTRSKTTEPATGMRAKPVRKPAASTRATRASARTATASEKREKSPLSPKKDAENLPLSRDADSDDELATLEKTPLKPLMKSPVKPPSMAKKHELQPPKDEEDDLKDAQEPTTTSVFGSPARRPPSSPFKDTMKSPARKVEAIPSLLFSTNTDQQATQAPSKPSILQSPAKRPQLPIKSLQPPSHESTGINHSPIKISLLQSPAKRPMSPFKLQGHPVPMFDNSPDKLFAPKMSPVQEKVPAKEVQQPTEQPEAMDTEDELSTNEEDEEPEDEHAQPESPSVLTFPGRLSAVLPRHADPALRKNPLPAKIAETTRPESAPISPVEAQEPVVDVAVNESDADAMEIDEDETKQEEVPSLASATPPSAPEQATKPAPSSAFGLRAKDLMDHEVSDSEDELAPSEKAVTKYQDDTTFTLSAIPATPTPSTFKTFRPTMPSSAAKAASRAIRSVSKGSKLGFTPLASQLGSWKASSPSKQSSSQQTSSPDLKDEGYSLLKDSDPSTTGSTPSKGFFDEEMRIRAEMENQAAIEAALEAEIEAMYGDTEPEFDNIPISDEDVQLAHEANEMSLIEEDAVSEASQEYGDENAVPIDPALFGSNARRLEPVTPSRPSAPKAFHTVSKVPLKPADDSTPRIVKKRSASVSKLPPTDRPGGLFRNATVISYSPTKDSSKMEIDGEDDEVQYPPVTPTKTDIWSSMGTPARTPRRDLNMALLRGAVVFVDVHTSDGADASAVFVELLQQMGARCVKSWPWNPTSPTGPDGSSKVGITHVVYKDGGKRTLEKVRETNGVVQCVGVGWVLDCERENEWLDESPYYVDTSLVPRGGHNRRKSMEPKALANFNGTLVTPMKQTGGSARECQTVPNNHISRRDSTVWMHTPSDHDEDEDAPCDHDWDREISMLTPVPKTPAPEAVRQFAMDVTPDSSAIDDSYGDFSPEKELLMRTCPPKSYADLGEGVLKREKDQGILMRLMAARRKSLQFAPKVASPLSKAWN
ncbi:uncharacterized protein GGS22DRAFT_59103 [Annulohypoxylon maeteangense]|uniref:uncharacterized protein n=1 Tax=Annulohypoxylon maeteangense TaxID=1927788 RepID=UPI00200893BF|nr:uncharacterized protein GGS22DRAFT_59103 [Annulohypoxylon maeteangense]KAI0881512.1 hypothetical protein GGS22DRAFT_59103 [Annulohypoxylon maeteangense]